MIEFQFDVKKLKLEAQKRDMVTTNTQNAIPCNFSFSEEWDGFEKTAVFYTGGERYSVLLREGGCILPSVEKKFHVGVIGVKGTSFLCSTLVKCEAERGADLDADDTPSQSVWQQYLAEIAGIKTEVLGARDDVSDMREETKGYRDTTQANTNTVIQQAQAVSSSKEAVALDKAEVAADAAQVARDKAETQQAKAEAQQLAAQMTAMLSSEPRQFLVKSLSDRDALEHLRQCDRCDVIDEMATYLYDLNDTDGDSVNPEWILVSRWDALNGVDWGVITNKPVFSTVAVSGSYNDLTDKPKRYEQFAVLSDGNFDFSVSDKAVITLTEDTVLNITNMYNGAVALLEVYGAKLLLPDNFKKSYDFDYLDIASPQHWIYVIVYDGVNYHVTRSVCDAQ